MTSFISNLPPPSTGVVHVQPETEVYVGNRSLGQGTLHIAESQLSWQGGSNFSIEYPSIGLHAISTDTALSPKPCLLVLVSGDLGSDQPMSNHSSNGEMGGDGDHCSDDEDNESEDEKTTEIKFIPQDSSSLEALYSHMAHCQSLHPDPHDSVSEEEEGDDDDFEGDEEEEDEEGAEEAAEEPMDMDGMQFEDA